MYYSININQIAISQYNTKYQGDLNLIDEFINLFISSNAT
jgi:hypothetical protein